METYDLENIDAGDRVDAVFSGKKKTVDFDE